MLPKSLEDRIKTLYDNAQNYIDDGNLEEAKIVYSEIGELKPNEESGGMKKEKYLSEQKLVMMC